MHIREKLVTTAKAHRCFGCWRLFPAKTKMWYTVGTAEGDFSANYDCEVCHKIIQSMPIDELLELSPGDLYSDAIKEEKSIPRESYKLLQKWWDPMPVAKRSGLTYIRHIDKSVPLLWRLVDDFNIVDAFILHPVIQNDADYERGVKFLIKNGVQPDVLMLIAEYRKTANSYLPRHEPCIPEASVDWRVNIMLLVDKLQNKADVMLHNKSIENYDKYIEYFDAWLRVLHPDHAAIGAEYMRTYDDT